MNRIISHTFASFESLDGTIQSLKSLIWIFIFCSSKNNDVSLIYTIRNGNVYEMEARNVVFHY